MATIKTQQTKTKTTSNSMIELQCVVHAQVCVHSENYPLKRMRVYMWLTLKLIKPTLSCNEGIPNKPDAHDTNSWCHSGKCIDFISHIWEVNSLRMLTSNYMLFLLLSVLLTMWNECRHASVGACSINAEVTNVK